MFRAIKIASSAPTRRLDERLQAFVRATDRGVYDPVARTVKWDLGSVAPGERRSVVWNGIVKEPGKLAFAASLKAGGKGQQEIRCPVKAIAPDGPAMPPTMLPMSDK